MSVELNEIEARVVGCLMEKSVLTPDQYPMTLNALTNACNQKSSRAPVMSLSQGDVQHALRALEAKHVIRCEENFKSQVEKYSHRLCNTPFSDYQFDPAQFAVMTVLLLRGARTPGELRTNSGRLHSFADNAEVEDTLNTLIDSEQGTLVVQLPRTPGRRDSEYMHLLCGEIDTSALEAVRGDSATGVESGPTLKQRVAQLEVELAELKQQLADLQGHGNIRAEQSPGAGPEVA